MNRLVIFILLILCIQNFNTYANVYRISGKVIIANNSSSPVVGATVRLTNTMLGTVTNSKGEFNINNIPQGNYQLLVTSIGMLPHTKDIIIDSDNLELENLYIEMYESAIKTDGIVVTATRADKIYEDVPVKLSILSDKIFESTSSVSLREGLNFQPGLRTETNCKNCGFSQVRINGLEGKYSQVLINGKANFSALNGVYGLEQIPFNMIDRVEVVRGGGSTLYGGNAVAGIINIITKEPCLNTVSASVHQSFINMNVPDNTLTLNSSIVSNEQNIGVFIFGMNRTRNEWDANSDGFTEISRLNVKSFGSRFFYKPDYKSKITGEFNLISHDIRGGDLLDNPPHQTNITEYAKHNTNSGHLAYEHFLNEGKNKFSIYSSYQKTIRNSYYGANQDANAYGNTDNLTFITGSQITHLIGKHILTMGYELNYDIIIDLAPAYDRTIDEKAIAHGFYIQDDWSISDKLFLVYGTRLEKHNLIKNFIVSPRFNFLYKIQNNLSLRTGFSTGYRAPQTFDEDLQITQVGGEGLLILSAPNLKPEYSFSHSSSLDYNFSLFNCKSAISFEYFYTKLNNVFVLEDQDKNETHFVLLRKNGEEANVYGTTFEFQIEPFKKHFLKFGLTYQQSKYGEAVEWSAEDRLTGKPAEQSRKFFKTPDLYGYFLSDIYIKDLLTLTLSGVYTGSMYIPHYAGYIENDELIKSKDFFEINLKLSYKFIKEANIELSMGMYNIFNAYQKDFDKGIERDAGYIYGPSRPRTIYWGINAYL